MVMVVGRILPVPSVGEETGDGRGMRRVRMTADSRGGLGDVDVTLVHERVLVVVMMVVVEKVSAHVL
jgi:hypothetical protein